MKVDKTIQEDENKPKFNRGYSFIAFTDEKAVKLKLKKFNLFSIFLFHFISLESVFASGFRATGSTAHNERGRPRRSAVGQKCLCYLHQPAIVLHLQSHW